MWIGASVNSGQEQKHCDCARNLLWQIQVAPLANNGMGATTNWILDYLRSSTSSNNLWDCALSRSRNKHSQRVKVFHSVELATRQRARSSVIETDGHGKGTSSVIRDGTKSVSAPGGLSLLVYLLAHISTRSSMCYVDIQRSKNLLLGAGTMNIEHAIRIE